MIAQTPLPRSARGRATPLVWTTVAAVMLATAYAMEPLAESGVIVSPTATAVAALFMRWYPMVLLGVAAVIVWQIGNEKELFRRYLPATLGPFLLADVAAKVLHHARPGEPAFAFPSEDMVLVFAFALSVIHLGHLRWGLVASGLLLVTIGSTLVTDQGRWPDIVAALGVSLLAIPIAARRAASRDVLAFGVVRAYRTYELFMMRYVAAADALRRELVGRSGLTVLDIGCGSGELRCFLPEPAVSLDGVELDEERAAAAEGRGYRVLRCELDGAALPYAAESFDAVVILHCLEHLKRPGVTLRAADRVLAAGGLLIIGVPVKPPGFAWIPRLRYEHRLRQRGAIWGETCQFFTLSSLRAFLAGALPTYDVLDVRGFRLFSARDSLPLEDWRWFWRLSCWLGRHFAAWTPEVNVVLRKAATLTATQHDGGVRVDARQRDGDGQSPADRDITGSPNS